MPIRIVERGKPSVLEDMGRSAMTGLTEGAAQFAGAFGDIRSMAETAAESIGSRMGVEGARLPGLGLPFTDLPAKFAGKVGELIGVDPRLTRLATAVVGPAGLGSAPTSAEVLGAVTDDKPLYQPQTRAGRYTRTVSQFAPAAAMPGGVVRRVANVVVPGAASEGAGELTDGSPLEPYARVAGALLGAGAVGAVGRPGPRTQILAEAVRGATDEQIAAARSLMEDAAARGVRLTVAEALQQVTGGATGLGRVQRVVEGTRGGAERIGPVMAERPAQVRGALTDFADTIAPPTQQPSMLGAAAQEGADGVLTGVRQQINANARPWYRALAQERMPPAPSWQRVQQSPAYQEGLQAVRGNPVLNAEIANLPDDSLAVVNEVVKHLDTLAENARPNPAASTGNAQMASAYGAAARGADEIASAFSEPWRLSRAMVGSQREAFLEPLQRGPMGAVSATDDIGAQTRAMFPAAPPEGMAAETAQALEMLQQQGAPARGLVRQHLVNTANEATQDLQSGPNPWGGAKWAAAQTGNPEQASTLRAGVEAVGGNRAELDRLVEVLRATGKRQPPGSQTAYNAKDLEELGKAGVAGEVLQGIASGPSTFRKIAENLQNWQTERNAGRLAEAILASPEQAEAILLHARRVVPPGQSLQTIEQLAVTAQLQQAQAAGR